MGYQFLHGVRGKLASSQVILVKEVNDRAQHVLDIRWRIASCHTLAGYYDLEELFENRTPLKTISATVGSPSHIDALLIAALYIAAGHRGHDRLIRYYDVHLLLSRLSATELDALPELCRRKGATRQVEGVIERTAELFGDQATGRLKTVD